MGANRIIESRVELTELQKYILSEWKPEDRYFCVGDTEYQLRQLADFGLLQVYCDGDTHSQAWSLTYAGKLAQEKLRLHSDLNSKPRITRHDNNPSNPGIQFDTVYLAWGLLASPFYGIKVHQTV